MFQFVVGWLWKSLLLALKSTLYKSTLYPTKTKASNPTYSTKELHPSMAVFVDIGHTDICLYIALWEGLVGGWHERKCIPSVDPYIPLFALCSYIYSPFCNLLHILPICISFHPQFSNQPEGRPLHIIRNYRSRKRSFTLCIYVSICARISSWNIFADFVTEIFFRLW